MSNLNLYRWHGIDMDGQYCTGYHFSPYRYRAEALLLAEGVIPYQLTRIHYRYFTSWHRKTLIIFFQQLESMLNAGLTLTASLELLIENQSSLPWRIMIELLVKKISAGEKLSTALEQWPQIFSPTVSALIRAGEFTGHLPNSCRQVSNLLTQQQIMHEEMVAALRYPCITLFFLIMTTSGLLLFILPEFALMYQSLNTPLPLFTQWLLTTSQFLNHYTPLFFIMLAPLLSTIYYLDKRYPKWRLTRHRRLLKIPLLGRLWQSRQLSLFFSTLASTQQAGLTLVNGLQLVTEIFTSPLWKKRTEAIYESLHRGEKLSQAMAHYEEYPVLSLLLIRSAEETGQLENAFLQLANWYSQQATTLRQRFTQGLEPVMLALSGGLVGSVVIALYLPIFYLGEALS
ncbi:type II secretion system F family protein [Rosenbergiella australiborealis]|uniref:type II secretion system F family protein n=1 Tax=Rosenbergiella australiborealis TaxID=1544696 RepID=UPI001F4F00A9|nr:type II secretion system F family protein [Rosenbergiella australiborealis]